jgi:hypothetical protein
MSVPDTGLLLKSISTLKNSIFHLIHITPRNVILNDGEESCVFIIGPITNKKS